MQTVLTYTVEITVIAGFGLIAIAFILGLIERWNRTTATFDAIRAELDELLAANAPEPMPLVKQEAIAPSIPSTPAPSIPVAPIPAAVPVANEADPFINELLAIGEPRQPKWWNECPLKQLRALGSLLEVRNSARWTKTQAIAYLSTATA